MEGFMGGSSGWRWREVGVDEDLRDLLRADPLWCFFFRCFLSFLDRSFLRCFFAVFLVGFEEVEDDEVEEAGVASDDVGAVGGGAICGSVTVGAVGVIANGKWACWVGGGPNIGTKVLNPV